MTSQFRTIIEPFRIKSVEPIRMTTVAEREEKLRAIDYARRGQIALAGGDPGVYRPSAVTVPEGLRFVSAEGLRCRGIP